MSDRLSRVAFWLVPAEPVRSWVQQQIDWLAERFSAPTFLPHLTLYTCQRSVAGQELAALAGLARQSRPLTLQSAGLSTTDRLTQTLVMRFAADESLLTMHRTLREAVQRPSPYQLEPHLSLLYMDLPDEERQRLTLEQEFPYDTVRFDELRAVAIPEQISHPRQIHSWQDLLVCGLPDPEA